MKVVTAASRRREFTTLVLIAVGGALGACARHGLTLLWPHGADGFPWTTLWINISGCALMGVLMVFLAEAATPHPFLRPFLGTGVLGGYTTFATFVVDAQSLATRGHTAIALFYLVATLTAGVACLCLSAAFTRRLIVVLAGGGHR